MARIYHGNRVSGDFSSVVSYARTDLKHFLDVFGKAPPAMFRRRPELDQWVTTNKLSWEPIPRSDCKIRIYGELEAVGEYVLYSQLWAEAAYKPYRRPWAAYHASSDKVAVKLLKTMHADHVINKERILPNFPAAWVMLFPVPGNSNSPFGSLIEHQLPCLSDVEVGRDGYAIDGLVGFKIFSTEYPRTEAELQEQLKAVCGQVPDWFYREVECAIKAKWVQKAGAKNAPSKS